MGIFYGICFYNVSPTDANFLHKEIDNKNDMYEMDRTVYLPFCDGYLFQNTSVHKWYWKKIRVSSMIMADEAKT